MADPSTPAPTSISDLYQETSGADPASDSDIAAGLDARVAQINREIETHKTAITALRKQRRKVLAAKAALDG